MKIDKKYGEGNKNVILFLSGTLDETTAFMAEKELNDTVSGEAENITLDLSNVIYISSIGIRSLIVAHKKAIKYGKKLVIDNLSPKAREILSTVGILQLFSVKGF